MGAFLAGSLPRVRVGIGCQGSTSRMLFLGPLLAMGRHVHSIFSQDEGVQGSHKSIHHGLGTRTCLNLVNARHEKCKIPNLETGF